MKSKLIILLAAALAGAGLWAGCTEDIPSGVTAIFGSVVDQTGAPIFNVWVGTTFSIRRVSERPGGVLPVAGVELRPPYPNPAVDPEGTDVSIPVFADADTTGRVEIWGAVGGVATRISTIFTGAIPAGGRTVLWDGSNQFDLPLPNGIYFVRLILPAGGTTAAAEYPVLINRSEAIVRGNSTREFFTTFSNADGDYVLDDLPVGERLTETTATGSVRGQALVENRLVVFFDDPDYQGGPEVVIIGPGQVVEVVTILQAINPVLAPAYGPGPILTASR